MVSRWNRRAFMGSVAGALATPYLLRKASADDTLMKCRNKRSRGLMVTSARSTCVRARPCRPSGQSQLFSSAAAKSEARPGQGPLIELLRVLLKRCCEEHQVAQRLVASADDLEAIAADDQAAVPALAGWRREIFGKDALALKHGRLGLTASNNRIELVPLPPD